MIARFKKGSYRWSVLAAVLLAVLGFVTFTDANPASESVPPSGEGLTFNGLSDFLEVPDTEQLDIGDTFTVEAWIKVHQAKGENAVLSKELPWKSGWTLITVQEKAAADQAPQSPEYILTFAVGDGGRFRNMTSLPCLHKDKWHHVAAVWDKRKGTLFVDGSFACSQMFTAAAPARVPLRIGKASANLGRHFNGVLSDIRIWNVARTEEDIRKDMKRKLTGKEKGLVSCWPLKKEPGEVINDISPNANHAKVVRVSGTPASAAGKQLELSYDDGTSEGKKSIAGSGHAVLFDAPSEGCILRSVRIYGSRYGYPKPPNENFHIWLCDEDFNVIEDFPFPYSRFARGNPK